MIINSLSLLKLSSILSKYYCKYINSIILFIFLPIILNATDIKLDTLSSFNGLFSPCYYSNPNIIEQASRFNIDSPCKIKDVKILLGGDSATGSCLVHFYAQESGAQNPKFENNLISPIKISKTKPGVEEIILHMDEEIIIPKNQFFISLSDFSKGINVITDNLKKIPSCLDNRGNDYLFQSIKLKDGTWQSSYFSYAITVIVENLYKDYSYIFEDVTEQFINNDTLYYNKCISSSDINQDGFVDLMIDGRLFKNENGESFFDITDQSGITGKPLANIFIDINNDGKIDILFLGVRDSNGNMTNKLFLNDGIGNFRTCEINMPEILNPTSFCLADINGDSYPDLFIAQGESFSQKPLSNLLLINDGNNGFIDRTSILYNKYKKSFPSYGTAWCDFDNDSDLDLFVSGKNNQIELWENLGNLRFNDIGNIKFPFEKFKATDFTDTNSIYFLGCDWSDFNNDGYYDLLQPVNNNISIVGSHLNQLSSTVFKNIGKSDFLLTPYDDRNSIIAEEMQTGGKFCDFNNDGLIDILLTTGEDCRFTDLYYQNFGGAFQNLNYKSGFYKKSLGEDALVTDINNDGKPDIITSEKNILKIYLNKEESKGNYIDFIPAFNNRHDFLGAKIDLYSNNKIFSQQFSSGNGFLIQNPMRIHIGLGTVETIDSAFITTNTYNKIPLHDLILNNINTINLDKDNISHDYLIEHYISPNPFKETTTIYYKLNSSLELEINIYTLTGQKVKEIIPFSYHLLGKYNIEWDGKDLCNNKLPNGVYIYKIISRNAIFVGKIILFE